MGGAAFGPEKSGAAGFLFWSIKHRVLIVDGYVIHTDVCECYSCVLGEQLALGYIYPMS